jgi:hypothetical protein
MEDHRSFPFARVAHLLLHNRRINELGLTSQRPVGRRQEQKVVSVAIALPGLKNRLLGRYSVPAVTIQEYDAAESMNDEIVDQVCKHIQISPRGRRQCPRKIEMMV